MSHLHVPDRMLTATLAVLVAISLGLTGRLWLANPFLLAPPPQAAGYVTADALQGVGPAGLLAPLRFMLHYGSGRTVGLADPGDPRFAALWDGARLLLAGVTPAEMAAAQPVDRLAMARAATGSDQSLELVFGASLPWQALWSTGSGGTWPQGAGPDVERVLVVPGASATELLLLSGDQGRRLSLPAAAGRRLAAELNADQTLRIGYEMRPLQAPPSSSVKLEPGIFVPSAGLDLGLLAVRGERVEPSALVAASFPDPSIVRRAVEDDGGQFFTNGEDWLRVLPSGAVQWSAPAGAAAAGDWLGALRRGVGFVETRGGWPSTAVLTAFGGVPAPGSFSLVGGEKQLSGYRFGFAVRYQGLPIFGSPDAILLTVGGSSVTGYQRNVPVALGRRGVATEVGAEQALAALAGDWPAGAGEPRLVEDVFPCYVYTAGSLLAPAWAFLLPGGQRALVDAASGRVVGLTHELP